MSVIAVKKYKDRIVIGADSQTTAGYVINKDKEAKLWRINEELVVAHTGETRSGLLFREYAQNKNPKYNNYNGIVSYMQEFLDYFRKKIGKVDANINSNFIIIYINKAYSFKADFYLREIKDFWADGCGQEFALALLWRGDTVDKAIEVACEFSPYCERPVNIIEQNI